MPPGGLRFANSLSTMVLTYILAVWGAFSLTGIDQSPLSLSVDPEFQLHVPRGEGNHIPVAPGCNILQKSTWKVVWASVDRLAISIPALVFVFVFVL